MPRLTSTEYLIRHQMLKRIWNNDRRQFSLLSYNQQRDLHDFFQPTSELDDQALLDKRSEITELDPSLPHRASKAFLAILRSKPNSRPKGLGRRTSGCVHWHDPKSTSTNLQKHYSNTCRSCRRKNVTASRKIAGTFVRT